CWSVQLAGTKLVFAPDAVVRFRHRRGARGYFRQEWVSGLEDFTLYDRFGSRGMPYPAPGFGTSRAALLRVVLGVRDRRAALRIGGDITRRVARWRAARGRHDDALK